MSGADRDHPVDVPGYPGTIDDLAIEVGRMRYDAVARFLGQLSREFGRQADADRARDRTQLATGLDALTADLAAATSTTSAIWQLCRGHVLHELALRPEIEE